MKHTTYTDTQQAIANEIYKCERVLSNLDIDNAPAELKEVRQASGEYYMNRLAQLRKETHDLRTSYYGTPDTLQAYRLTQ